MQYSVPRTVETAALNGIVFVTTRTGHNEVTAWTIDNWENELERFSNTKVLVGRLRVLWTRHLGFGIGDVAIDPHDRVHIVVQTNPLVREFTRIVALRLCDGAEIETDMDTEGVLSIAFASEKLCENRVFKAFCDVPELTKFPPGIVPLCVSYAAERMAITSTYTLVTCVDMITGPRWKYFQGFPNSNPSIAIDLNGMIHIMSGIAGGFALHPSDGRAWTPPWADALAKSGIVRRGTPRLTVDAHNRVVVGVWGHGVLCYNADGSLAWTCLDFPYVTDVRCVNRQLLLVDFSTRLDRIAVISEDGIPVALLKGLIGMHYPLCHLATAPLHP